VAAKICNTQTEYVPHAAATKVVQVWRNAAVRRDSMSVNQASVCHR
jgi:predicted alpha/beta hydrolase